MNAIVKVYSQDPCDDTTDDRIRFISDPWKADIILNPRDPACAANKFRHAIIAVKRNDTTLYTRENMVITSNPLTDAMEFLGLYGEDDTNDITSDDYADEYADDYINYGEKIIR